VLDDADLEQAISAAAFGSFFHQGQICMTIGRHVVHESLYPEYVQRLAAKADGLPVGDPATGQVALGPLIDAQQRDRVHHLVTSSVAAGARLAAGGTYQDLFYRPTVLADAGPSIPAYQQEVFGPVAAITPSATVDDAVKLASDSEYGLSLGILTANVTRGLELAERGSPPASPTSTIRPSTTRHTSPSAACWRPGPVPGSVAPPPTSTRSPRPAGSPPAATFPASPSERVMNSTRPTFQARPPVEGPGPCSEGWLPSACCAATGIGACSTTSIWPRTHRLISRPDHKEQPCSLQVTACCRATRPRNCLCTMCTGGNERRADHSGW
jgi:hypothetical protein